jgi:phosphatidylinositol glycan class N
MQMFKIIAPFVILASVFATLNARLHLPPFSLFLIALTLTDGERTALPSFGDPPWTRQTDLIAGMTVTFFFQVTDTGSWLEIGQSISFFCITSLLLVWSAGICGLGEGLMAETLVEYRTPQVTIRKDD